MADLRLLSGVLLRATLVSMLTVCGFSAGAGVERDTSGASRVGSTSSEDSGDDAGWRPTVDLEFAFLSHYVWRGQLCTDGPVFQPAVSIASHGLSLEVWANQDLDDANDSEGEATEVDLTLLYEREFELLDVDWSLVGGVTGFLYPSSSDEATVELIAGLALEVPLRPTFHVYRDVAEIDGTYLNLGLEHGFDWRSLTLDLAASVGWGDRDYNSGYFDVEESGFEDLLLSASVSWEQEWLTLAPVVSYSQLLDSRLRDAAEDPYVWFGGLEISISF